MIENPDHPLLLEDSMAKTKNTPRDKVEAAAEQPKQPSHTDKIKSQVLAKIGKLSRLDRVEISHHHSGKYRVNIWQQTEPDKNIAITTGLRIGLSYYLTVSDTGEIIQSNPPTDQSGFSSLNLAGQSCSTSEARRHLCGKTIWVRNFA